MYIQHQNEPLCGDLQGHSGEVAGFGVVSSLRNLVFCVLLAVAVLQVSLLVPKGTHRFNSFSGVPFRCFCNDCESG